MTGVKISRSTSLHPSEPGMGRLSNPRASGLPAPPVSGLPAPPVSPCACRSPGYLGGVREEERGREVSAVPFLGRAAGWQGSVSLCTQAAGCDADGEPGVGAGPKSTHPSQSGCLQRGGDTRAGIPGFWGGREFSPGVKPGLSVSEHPGVSVHRSASLGEAGKAKGEGEGVIQPWPLPRLSLPALFTTAGEEGLDPIRKRGRVGRAEGRIWPPTFASSSSSSSPMGAGLARREHRNPGSRAPGKGQGEGKRAWRAAGQILFSGKQPLG